MAKFIEKWSVASVFNEWGMARFEDACDWWILRTASLSNFLDEFR